MSATPATEAENPHQRPNVGRRAPRTALAVARMRYRGYRRTTKATLPERLKADPRFKEMTGSQTVIIVGARPPKPTGTSDEKPDPDQA